MKASACADGDAEFGEVELEGITDHALREAVHFVQGAEAAEVHLVLLAAGRFLGEGRGHIVEVVELVPVAALISSVK